MRRPLAAVAVLVVCTVCFAGVGAAAHEEPDRDILGLELDAEGDAVVYYVESYDLNDTDQRERYESFADNESRRVAHRDEVLAELEAAAGGGRNRTELDMRVGDGSVRTYEQGGYGRVEVRAEWENVGFYNDRRVVVTEPFRGGYAPNLSRVAIHGPDGYRRGTMQPTPLRARMNSSLWNPRTSDFSEFYAEFENPDADPDGDGGGGDGGSGGGDGGSGGDGDGGDWSDGAGAFVQALLLALVPLAIVLLALRGRQ